MLNKALRFSAVSLRRQQLIRMCQMVNFGTIRGIRLQDGEPLLESASLLAEERLDLPPEIRPEIQLDDFKLREEWCRLLTRFDAIQTGSIERLLVRRGIPYRVFFESRVPQL